MKHRRLPEGAFLLKRFSFYSMPHNRKTAGDPQKVDGKKQNSFCQKNCEISLQENINLQFVDNFRCWKKVRIKLK